MLVIVCHVSKYINLHEVIDHYFKLLPLSVPSGAFIFFCLYMVFFVPVAINLEDLKARKKATYVLTLK